MTEKTKVLSYRVPLDQVAFIDEFIKNFIVNKDYILTEWYKGYANEELDKSFLVLKFKKKV